MLFVDQMSLTLDWLIGHTPPTGMAAIGGDVGGLGDRRRGEQAVERDVMKVFEPLKEETQWWEVDTSKTYDVERIQQAYLIKRASGAFYATDRDLFRPDATEGEIYQHHQKFRSKVTGRVTTAGRRDEIIGRWRFVDIMHVKADRLKSYIKKAQKSVGRLRAGWVPASLAFAARAKRVAKIPDWVMSQANKAGTFTDAMDKDGNGYLESANSTPYAGVNRALVRIADFALARAQRNLSRYSQKRIQQICDRFNKAGAPGGVLASFRAGTLEQAA
jgi:hypothetical protein